MTETGDGMPKYECQVRIYGDKKSKLVSLLIQRYLNKSCCCCSVHRKKKEESDPRGRGCLILSRWKLACIVVCR